MEHRYKGHNRPFDEINEMTKRSIVKVFVFGTLSTLGLFGLSMHTVAQTSLQHEIEQGAHSNRGGEPRPPLPPSDPMKDRTDSLMGFAGMLHDSWNRYVDAVGTLANNPNYKKMAEGEWAYYQEGEPPAPGQKCAATFVNVDGMLSVAAMGGYKDPALLLLSGVDVPRPHNEGTIRATLHQTGERPQNVSVQNFTASGMNVGTVAFAIPSLEAAVQGLEDEAEIAVDVDGKRIYMLKYHSGHQASTELERCAKTGG